MKEKEFDIKRYYDDEEHAYRCVQEALRRLEAFQHVLELHGKEPKYKLSINPVKGKDEALSSYSSEDIEGELVEEFKVVYAKNRGGSWLQKIEDAFDYYNGKAQPKQIINYIKDFDNQIPIEKIQSNVYNTLMNKTKEGIYRKILGDKPNEVYYEKTSKSK